MDKEKASPHHPKIKYSGVKAMPFIVGNEAFEKLGTIATSANLMVYLTTFFNMKSDTAAVFVNIYSGTANMAPFFGAILADSCFGCYKTLAFASVSSIVGMTMVMLTTVLSSLHPPHCDAKQTGNCVGPSPGQLAFLLGGFGFLVVGAGGIRSCSLPFGADQFDPNIDSGRKGINTFFNWYFTIAIAVVVSLTGIVYVQSHFGWSIGLAIPACLMYVSVVLFIMGSKIYVKVKPTGSPLTSVAQVLLMLQPRNGG